MRKNGFTLIELLAVIVILAIIALIATPIILGIINDARKESQERSVELYASAIRNGIAAYQLREMKEVAAGSYTSETLPFDVEYDGDVECSTIELYEDGGVYVTGCTVNDLEVDYAYGTKQEKVVKISEVCTLESGTALTQGAKYNCKVDPNKEAYTFYVLTTPAEGATSVNLIMDSNITSTGVAIKGEKSNLGLVAWYADDMDNSYGPITAMNHLQTATAGWRNVNPQTINTFTDDEGNTHEMAEYVVNARLPYSSEISDYDGTNAYLYNNLSFECYDDQGEEIACEEATEKYGIFEEGIGKKLGVEGYWTLSSYYSNTGKAWYVDYMGNLHYELVSVNDDSRYGVRPVINLSI